MTTPLHEDPTQYASHEEHIAALYNELKVLKESNKHLAVKLKEKETELMKLQKAESKSVATDDDLATSKRFNMVTVLFSTIRGFTKLSQSDDAQAMVDKLDHFYYEFDAIVERYNIKKVKSIGDTYMCAGGIPKKNRTNPFEVVLAALEIQSVMQRMSHDAEEQHKSIWKLSIGIHTGPVVATIFTGKKRASYELKGDSANIASRIEASGTTGKVIISAMTYEFVREFFDCEYLGTLPVKYVGDIAMYEVKGFKLNYSDDPALLIPNAKFNLRFGYIRFDDLEEYILNRLEKELPHYLYYHNVKHTMDVTIGVEIMGTSEGVSDEELLLLKTAGLFHDMGQIVQSKGHEEISCKFARDILPKWGYTPAQLDLICSIIMATQLPPNPKTLLERIICDADLDYLGRTDFIPVSDTLFRELSEQNIITDKNEWNKLQVKFISGHQYFTDFALNNREVNKQKQIERIKQLIQE